MNLKQTRITMKKIINIIIPVILLAAFAAACSDEAPEEKIPLSEQITTDTVKQITYADTVFATGFVTYEDEYKLSFKTSGIIDLINVDEGQRVREGGIIASLKLEEVNAKAAQAKSSAEKAKRDYERTQALYADSVATLEQLQNARTQLEQTQSDLEAANFNLRHSQIIAPSSGLVQKVLLSENETVQAGSPVVIFGSDNSNKILKTNISDREIVKVALNDSALIKFDAFPGKMFSGIVDEIAGVADTKTGTYEVKLSLPDPNNLLKSGFIGNTKIIPSNKKSLYEIPVEALLYAQGNKGAVYIVNNGTAIKKEIIIDKVEDERLLIEKGLQDGDKLIVEGQEDLDGDKINLNEK